MGAEAKNLEAISKAIDQHNAVPLAGVGGADEPVRGRAPRAGRRSAACRSSPIPRSAPGASGSSARARARARGSRRPRRSASRSIGGARPPLNLARLGGAHERRRGRAPRLRQEIRGTADRGGSRDRHRAPPHRALARRLGGVARGAEATDPRPALEVQPEVAGDLLRPDVELGEAAAEDQDAHRDQDPAADGDDRAVVALDHRERGRRAREGERGEQERDREPERVDGEQEGAVGELAVDPGEREDAAERRARCTASRRSRTPRRRRSARPCRRARAARRRATRGSGGRRTWRR